MISHSLLGSSSNSKKKKKKNGVTLGTEIYSRVGTMTSSKCLIQNELSVICKYFSVLQSFISAFFLLFTLVIFCLYIHTNFAFPSISLFFSLYNLHMCVLVYVFLKLFLFLIVPLLLVPLLFVCFLIVCFLKKERNKLWMDRWEGEKQLRADEGEETIFKLYCMKNLFQ